MTQQQTQPISKPWANAKIVKLLGNSYWKATGEKFHPDRKVLQQLLKDLDQEYQISKRLSPPPVAAPDGLLIEHELDGLALPDLRHALREQSQLKRHCEDGLCAGRALLSTLNQNIQAIRERIRRLSPTESPTNVADHAVLRYLQRVKGMDIEAIRAEIDTPALRESIRQHGEGKFVIDGVTHVVAHETLVTIIYDGEPA